jgi:hypothetical protein
MAEDWPSSHHHEPHPLPRVEDLPVAWEGYDRERVQAAFDAFYRHIAQLDSTLRALEAVDVFRSQAADLRTELRSLRTAGWAPYPRGYALTPERSMLGTVPDAVPRIALEVIFLIVVAAVVAVAKFSALEIVAVMAGAALIVVLVELVAGRERRAAATTPIPAEPLAPAAAATAAPVFVGPPPPAPVADANQPTTGELSLVPESQREAPGDDELGGWAPFAEPAGAEAPSVMAALAVEEEQPMVDEPPAPEPESVAEAEPSPGPMARAEPEAEPESAAVADGDDAETGALAAARRRFGRRRRAVPGADDESEDESPKHVRVLPPREAAVAEAELPPWERGFDDTEERR